MWWLLARPWSGVFWRVLRIPDLNRGRQFRPTAAWKRGYCPMGSDPPCVNLLERPREQAPIPAPPLAAKGLKRGSLGGGAVTGKHLLLLFPEYDWPSFPRLSTIKMAEGRWCRDRALVWEFRGHCGHTTHPPGPWSPGLSQGTHFLGGLPEWGRGPLTP